MADQNIKGKIDTTGDTVGAATGGIAGVATGAAIGSLGGPIGTIIGALAGAAGGWWSGRAISEAASTYTADDDTHYQTHYRSSGPANQASRRAYDDVRPAYQVGHLAGVNPDYAGRSFGDVEPHLQTAYAASGRTDWDDVRGYARDAYARGRDTGEQRLVLAEEELRVGKQQVQAGEVSLRKTVETRHVQETVPLVHEEVTIERRPLSGDVAVDDIREETIRVPLMAEEAVVAKKVVPVEEVVLRKHEVTENQTVQDTVRKERLVTEGLDDVDTTDRRI